MNEGFDHLTVVVTDLDEARRFFGLLGFTERVAVVVSGETMERYMGIADWEADHVRWCSRARPCTRRSSCCTSTGRQRWWTRGPDRSTARASTTCASG